MCHTVCNIPEGDEELKRELGDEEMGAGRQGIGSWETRGWELGDKGVRRGDGEK